MLSRIMNFRCVQKVAMDGDKDEDFLYQDIKICEHIMKKEEEEGEEKCFEEEGQEEEEGEEKCFEEEGQEEEEGEEKCFEEEGQEEEEGEEKCFEEEGQEEEDVSLKEEPALQIQLHCKKPTIVKVYNLDTALKCRIVKIGSMKIEAKSPLLYVPVYLGSNGIIIEVPTLNNPKKLLSVVLTPKDVDYTLIHFGEHLNIVFIVTKSKFAECIKHELTEDNYFYFDPNSKDQKCKFIILWIDSITENQVEFLKYGFSGKTNIKEIDQETASEILVRSTPRQEPVIKFPPEEQITQKSSGFEIIIYPTPPQIGGIVVTRKDFATLNEKEYLNDVIIDFYLKYFLDQHPAESEKTHLFSSYFYCSLTQKSSFDNGQEKIQHHNRVHRWTKHVDIFSKDFIIIPINQNRHWFLAIICFPGQVTTNSDAKEDSEGEGNSHTQDENLTNGANVVKPMPMPEALDSSTHPDENYGNRRLEIPCIYIFDSLSGPDRREVITTLREYLDIEWTLKKGTRKRFDVSTIQGYILQCPQQKNNHDCGLYLLQYVESFFQNPIPFYLNSVPDLKNWFKAEDVLFKRSKIKALILNLQKKQLENTATICKERQ